MESFASSVLDRVDARLILAGPSVHAVADDPEAAAVYREVERRWQLLPSAERERIELAQLPMHDLDENAAIVNALQRQATVIVKKSLEEGFGLGVTEAMWKRRPVIASRVGGHQDQIQDGISGVLLDDPRDLAAFGGAVADLLLDPDRARRLGDAAQQRVREQLPPRPLPLAVGRAAGDAAGAMSEPPRPRAPCRLDVTEAADARHRCCARLVGKPVGDAAGSFRRVGSRASGAIAKATHSGA